MMSPDNSIITTAPFAPVAPSAYLGLMARRMLRRRWWLFTLPLAVIAIGLFTDWRVAVIGLMLVFIVYPMVMSLVMLNHALDPSIIARARTARAAFAGDYLFLAPPTFPFGPAPARRHHKSRPTTIAAAKIDKISVGRGQVTIITGKAIGDIVIIPERSLRPESLKQLLERFARDYE